MTTMNTVGDVVGFACANLNDTQQAIWNDAKIMPHVRAAVNWLATQIANVASSYFEKWVGDPYTSTDIAYTAAVSPATPVCNITSLMPADLYEPISLEWRLTSSDQWAPMERATKLDANGGTPGPNGLSKWEWSNRTLWVQPSAVNALSCNAVCRLILASVTTVLVALAVSVT